MMDGNVWEQIAKHFGKGNFTLSDVLMCQASFSFKAVPLYCWSKYSLDRSTTYPKFERTRVQTHGL